MPAIAAGGGGGSMHAVYFFLSQGGTVTALGRIKPLNTYCGLGAKLLAFVIVAGYPLIFQMKNTEPQNGEVTCPRLKELVGG